MRHNVIAKLECVNDTGMEEYITRNKRYNAYIDYGDEWEIKDNNMLTKIINKERFKVIETKI